jgi:hypothetical protein
MIFLVEKLESGVASQKLGARFTGRMARRHGGFKPQLTTANYIKK